MPPMSLAGHMDTARQEKGHPPEWQRRWRRVVITTYDRRGANELARNSTEGQAAALLGGKECSRRL